MSEDGKLIFPSLLLVILLLADIFLLAYILAVSGFSVPKLARALSSDWYLPTQKQGSFDFITATPGPTATPKTEMAADNPNTPIPQTDAPPPATKQYCVDEAPGTVTIESCDDRTRCDIAHGAGGPQGSCGTVMGWEHTIIEFLLGSTGIYNNRLSDNLSSAIQSSCYTAAPYAPYISTFNVIDSYNLAGFHEFSRGSHADATALANAWKGTASYTTSTTANGLTPGDGVLFSNPPHAAVVNTVEVDKTRGNGEIWFLHTGATYYLGKLIIANWQVVASSTGDNSVTFGSHQSKGPDSTIGETVCYCGNICYQWKFQ